MGLGWYPPLREENAEDFPRVLGLSDRARGALDGELPVVFLPIVVTEELGSDVDRSGRQQANGRGPDMTAVTLHSVINVNINVVLVC